MRYFKLVILGLLFIQAEYMVGQCNQASGTVVVTEPGCDGNSGQIEVTATGGTGPYEYGIGGWTTQTSNVFSGLSAGTYNVRIVTADNCESWIYGVVLNYTPMEFSGSIVQQTCYDYVAGSVNIVPSRGVAPYTYSSDGGATYNNVNFFQQLDVGSYSYKIKDANGCVEDANFVITKSHIDPSVVSTPVQCTGIMGTAVVTFGGPDNYTFSIDNNASVQSGTGTYSYSQLTPGSYQIQCSDINGCNESFDFVVEDENISSSITGLTQETCNDTNGVFTISTTNGVGPYQYSIDGGLTFVGTDQFVNLNEGVYQAKVIDSRGCESSELVTITNTGGVSGFINQDTTICNGDVANLTVEALGESLTYSWSGGLSSDSIHQVNPSITTTYNVSVVDMYGCDLPLTTTVTVNDYPNLTVSNSTIDLCFGDSIAISSSGASSYLWSNGDTISNTMVRTPFGASSIDVYGFNGQCEMSISIPVSVHSIDASITDSQHVCIGESTTLYVNSVTPVLYDWENSSASSSSQTVFPTVATDYSVVLTDAFGCSDTLRTYVFVDEDVDLVVSPIEIEACIGDDFSLVASGATDYSWSDGQVTSLISLTATANEVITVTGVNGECSQSLSVPITVLPLPLVEITSNASSVSTGGGIQFGVGASNASSYEWDFADGGTADFAIPYHEFIFSGAYYVTLTGYIGSCSTTDTMLVYVGTVNIENKEDNLLAIYPNPIVDYLNINVKNDISKIHILDASGKLIKEIELNESINRISFADFPSGVYFISYRSEGNSFYKKVMKH